MELDFTRSPDPVTNARQPLHFRMPFLTQPQGLGDTIAALTEALGLKPCPPCQKRQERLNRALQFDPWNT